MKIEIQLNQISLLIKGLCLLDGFFVCGMMVLRLNKDITEKIPFKIIIIYRGLSSIKGVSFEKNTLISSVVFHQDFNNPEVFRSNL